MIRCQVATQKSKDGSMLRKQGGHQRNGELFLYFQRQHTINTNVQFNVVTQTYATDAENLNIVNKKRRK